MRLQACTVDQAHFPSPHVPDWPCCSSPGCWIRPSALVLHMLNQAHCSGLPHTPGQPYYPGPIWMTRGAVSYDSQGMEIWQWWSSGCVNCYRSPTVKFLDMWEPCGTDDMAPQMTWLHYSMIKYVQTHQVHCAIYL